VVTVTFDSAVEEGRYLNDLIFPSSSPIKNRGIFCVRASGRWRSEGWGDEFGEFGPVQLDLRFGNSSPLYSQPDRGGLTACNNDVMDTVLKELEKLQKLVSDEPSTGKSKTPAIQESLNSLLQTLHVQKKRLEAGLATEAELSSLARTVEARKKEIDERQKEIYNSLARYGKALDKVSR
jgi:hypothetical protein